MVTKISDVGKGLKRHGLTVTPLQYIYNAMACGCGNGSEKYQGCIWDKMLGFSLTFRSIVNITQPGFDLLQLLPQKDILVVDITYFLMCTYEVSIKIYVHWYQIYCYMRTLATFQPNIWILTLQF